MHQPGHASASAKTLDGLTRVRPVPYAEQRRGSGHLVRHQYLDDLAMRQVRPRIRWPQPVDDPRDVQPTQKLGSDRQRAPRRLVTTDSITTSTRGRSVRPNDTPGRLRDGPQTKRSAAETAGRARAAELDLIPRRRQPTPKPLLPFSQLRAVPTWNTDGGPRGFLPLRVGQAVLRPPGDLAGRAQPARESDRRSDRTGRWSVAPTALDPLPPQTPRLMRTGPGGWPAVCQPGTHRFCGWFSCVAAWSMTVSGRWAPEC